MDREARIAQARATRQARLASTGTSDSLKTYVSWAKAQVIGIANSWWSRFQQHLVDSDAYNDQPTVNTPTGPVLDLTYGIVTQFLTFFAQNCIPRKHDRISQYSVRNIWNGLTFYYESHLAIRVNDIARTAASDTFERLRKDGTTPDYPPASSFVTVDAFQAIAQAAFDLRWKSRTTFQRWQFLFLHSVELSTGCRLASHLPNHKEPIETARPVRYGDFVINVGRGTNGNDIALTYTPPRHKTGTTRRDEKSLLPREELWRCPVAWFLVLATLDDALPYSIEQLYHPDILGGEQSRNFTVLPTHTSRSVCRASTNEQDHQNHGRDFWTGATFWEYLGIACRIARLPERIKVHDYRRTGAVMMLAAGYTLQQIAYTIGHKMAQATRRYLQGIMPVSGGATMFGTAERTVDMLDHHPSAIRPAPALPVLPPITSIRRAAGEEEVECKDAAELIAAELSDKYADPKLYPVEDAKRLKKAWVRYAKQMVRYTKYYDDVDLYELSREAGSEDLASLATTGTDDAALDIAVQSAVSDDPNSQNLFAIIEDGLSYRYQASHIETLLMCERLETVEDVANFIERNRRAADQGLDDLVGTTASTVPVVDTTSTCTVASTAMIQMDEGDANESAAIDHLSEMSRFAFAPGGTAASRIRLAELAGMLPTKTTEWRGYRAGHFPVNGQCPAHDRPIDQCCDSDRNYKAHVHTAMAQLALDTYGPELAKKSPTTHEKPLFRAPPGQRRSLPKCDGLAYQANYMHRTLTGEGYTLHCNHCPDEYELFASDQTFSHFCLEHAIVLPQGEKSVHSAPKKGQDAMDWQADHLLPWYTRWEPTQMSYLVDPIELERYSKQEYDGMVATTVPYGMRDDVDIPADVLPHTPRELASDTRFVLGRDYGNLVQPGRCFICFHSSTSSYTTAMRPFEDSSSLRPHCYTCLKRLLTALRDYLSDSPQQGPSNRAASRFARRRAATARLPWIRDDRLVCAHPDCDGTFDSLLEFTRHLILVHHFAPFILPVTKRGIVKSLDTMVPMNDQDIEDLIDSRELYSFVPPGLRETTLKRGSKQSSQRDAKKAKKD